MSKIEEAILKANLMRQNNLRSRDDSACSPPVRDNPKRVKRHWPYFVGILLVLVAGGGAYHFASGVTNHSTPKPVTAHVSAKTAPAARQEVQLPAPAPVTPLPACIPLNSPDPAYSSSHPGWQRYTTEELEFRVFREGAAVRAIQVIARGENEIANSFFMSFLNEVSGGEKHTLQAGKERNGLFVEQGTAGKTAELLVYREKPAGEIRAFVVAYL